MSNTLKEGYVVTLKSGGPKMVIERIDSDGDTICT